MACRIEGFKIRITDKTSGNLLSCWINLRNFLFEASDMVTEKLNFTQSEKSMERMYKN